MLNNDLDYERWRRELAARGRVQVPEFLQAAAAERLHDCLRREVPWSTAERGRPDVPAAPGDAADRALLEGAYATAEREGFHFVYDRYLMVEARKEGRDPDLVLHAVLEFFNGPQFLDFLRYFTGDRTINMVGAQATRYRPGQFLRVHDDQHAGEGRRYAYVINLSRDWEPDWGGLLHFTDASGAMVESFVPRFNSLSLFKVPMAHHVGLVAPWAREPRLAITGWWHAKHD
jgi:hypothetical protein